jgi:phosphatidylinositol alpha 1,6-mannosyltransferase
MNPQPRPIQRILIVTETFLPKIDGISNTLVHLLEYFSQNGIECQMLAPEGAPDLVHQAKIHPVKSYPFPLYPELKLPSPFTDMSPYIEKFKPDLIHVVNPVGLGLAAIRQAGQHHIPVIASYHTDIPGFAEKWGLGIFQEPLWQYFRWVHNQADRTLVPSHYTLHQLKQHGYQRLGIWSRGVDRVLFNPDRRSQQMRIRLSDGHADQPLLLFAGRLALEKRIDWLLPILYANPGARLAIIGDGPARPKLQELFTNEAAVFTGYLHGEELACAYASADWFVFPAANETLGNVVLEAMSAGLPVIAADAGGQVDHVYHGRNGLLFNAGRIESLISTATRAITDDALREYMSVRARTDSSGLGWDPVFANLIGEYELTVRHHQKEISRPALFKPLAMPKESY